MAERWLSRPLQCAVGLPGRVAGTGGRSSDAARSGSAPGIRYHDARKTRAARGTLAGGVFLAVALFLTLGSAQAQVLSSRIWPARDYTRLTLESPVEVKYSLFTLKDPVRLVLDLEVGEVSPALAELNAKVAADDPYIHGLRVARNRPGVVRLVLDLKAEVKPQVFTLPPIGEYGHRLVLDIYPAVAIDPLASLIEESAMKALLEEKGQARAPADRNEPAPAPPPMALPGKPTPPAAEKPKVARLATIVID